MAIPTGGYLLGVAQRALAAREERKKAQEAEAQAATNAVLKRLVEEDRRYYDSFDEEGRSIAERFGEIKRPIQQTRLEQAKLREGMVVAPAIPNPQSRNLIGTGLVEAALDTGVGLGLKGAGLGLKAAGGLIGRTSVQTGLPKRALGQAAKGQIGGSSAVQQEIAGAPGVIGAKLHPSEEWGRAGYTPKLLGEGTYEGPWGPGMPSHQHNEASRELWGLKRRNEGGWISNPQIKDNSNTFYVLRQTEGQPNHRGAVLGGAFEEFDGERHLVELHFADDVIDNDAAISRLIDEAEDQFDTYYAGARGATQYIEPWADAGVSELRRRGYITDGFIHPRTGSTMWRRGDATTAGASLDEIEEARRLWSEQGTDSPYFKRWFGDSPVVDADGDPLVLYRGSRGPTRGMLGRSQYAAFASDNPGVAAGYADKITPLYVKADKVIEYTKTRTNVGFDDAAMRLRPGEALVVRKSRDAGPMHQAGPEFELPQEIIGPDGKVKVFTDAYSGDIWAFPPGTPSKSAIANRGTFDPTNPHMSYSAAPIIGAGAASAAASRAMSGEAEGEEASIDNPHGRK